MIIVQTPLRVSFLGGGTDFEGFYSQHGGAVLSTGIDKCVYVVIKERFDDLIYINYSQKEIVENVAEIQHDLVREAMRMTGVSNGVEITSMADIPTEGTGLGSSSSFTVALLHGLYAHQGERKEPEKIAEEACKIEIDILGAPIGKQDQYIAAYGGLRFIAFNGFGVRPERIKLDSQKMKSFNDNLLLFYTGKTRKANGVLAEQKSNIDEKVGVLSEMRDMAYQGKEAINCGEFDEFGEIMHHGWELKKGLASRISNQEIDEMYDAAHKAGAIGGKISGAGGGGFMLLYCPRRKQDDVRSSLSKLRELPFRFEADGSKVIFNYRRT